MRWYCAAHSNVGINLTNMNNTSLLVTFVQQGAMSFLRESKKVSKHEASQFITRAQKDPVMGTRAFMYLPTGTVINVDSKAIEHSCVRKIQFDSEKVESILNGSNPPSYFQQRQHKLSTKHNGRRVFDRNKWKRMSEAQRLSIWFSDLMHDFGAKSFAWELLS